MEVAPGKVQNACKPRGAWNQSLEYVRSGTVWLLAFRDAWKVMIASEYL